jgi:hypothetical protein
VQHVASLAVATADGTRVPVAVREWGLAAELPPGTRLVTGTIDMGLFQRPGSDVAVKLDYDTKAVLDPADAAVAQGMAVEIILLPAEGVADELVARVLLRGAPAPGATVYVPRPDAPEPVQVTADDAGEVRLPRPRGGVLELRARVAISEPGELDGKPFAARHRYAMLTVTDVRAEPLPPGAEREAWQRLDAARRHRARQPVEVVSLAGVLYVELDGPPVRGEFSARADGLVQLELPELDPRDAAWIGREVEALVVPLLAPTPTEVPATLTLRPRDGHPLGRRIDAGELGSWRVADGRVRATTAREAGRLVTREHLAFADLAHGRSLPVATVVSTYDAGTGALLATRTSHDEVDQREDGVILPVSRWVVASEEGGPRTARIVFRNLEIERAAPEGD